jgi:iron complex outermembrane recepter protein
VKLKSSSGYAVLVSEKQRVRVAIFAILAAPLAVAALMPGSALAQSTGTEAAEDQLQEVVVTGRRGPMVLSGVTEQTAPKSRVTVMGDFLSNQSAGQTILESLNQVPGLTFTNNDPYGSSGGNFRLRSFDNSRVSLTFDGIPLNDTGNYASFTNQLPDTEIIQQVDVNLGTTDVDSPTASATGGTIAWRTREPLEEFGGLAVASVGENSFKRGFVRVDSGEFGPWGTRAFATASYTQYDKFRGFGDLEKKQFNARIRQDIGEGNFVAVGLHWNQNRNFQYRNNSSTAFAQFGRDYDWLGSCTRQAPGAGRQDDGATPFPTTPALASGENVLNPSACSNYFGVRLNPSDTGNIRINSLWRLGEKFILTVDPSFQYTLANGGGAGNTVSETPLANNADRRIVGTTTLAGFDINGDGDILDVIRLYSPNNTNTKRYGLNASLIWQLSEQHRLRMAYTLDYGKHRQTGQWNPLDASGNPENVFAGRQGRTVPTADGSVLRGRDRYSVAVLNQVAFEYRGQFLDERLLATVGVRAPFFKRDINQYCYTPDGGTGNTGGALCTTQVPVATRPNGNVVFVNLPTAVQYIAPYRDIIEFEEILPNVGLTWKLNDDQSLYFTYSGGLSAPRTDNLYPVRRQTDGSIGRGIPESENTNSFDLGWRYQGEALLASAAYWSSKYENRIVAAFDQDLGFNVDRNVGDVDLQGFEVQVGWRPLEKLTLNGSASYTDSELQDDLRVSATVVQPLKGKKLVETPDWTVGARAEYAVTPALRVGLQAKYTGDRFATDLNDEVAKSYTVADLDIRYQFDVQAVQELSVQFNVNNLFDEEYFGSISSGIGGTAVAFYQIGPPRTATLSVRVGF